MMKRAGRLLAALVCAVLLTGCNTSRLTATRPAAGMLSAGGNKVIAQLAGTNTGVFLFYFIPLWSGNPRHPNQHEYDPFTNQIRPKHMYIMFNHWANKHDADAVEDVKIRETDKGWWSLGIFWLRRITATGVAVRYPKKREE